MGKSLELNKPIDSLGEESKRPIAALEVLSALRREKLEKEKEETKEKSVEAVLAGSPDLIKKEVRDEIDMLVEMFNFDQSDEKVKEKIVGFAEIIRDKVRERYLESRFNCIKKDLLRSEISRQIDSLLDQENIEAQEKQLQGKALISLDLNGLKSVNDLASHKEGDLYLKRAVGVLQEGNTSRRLEELGVDVTVAAGTGDEFFVWLSAGFDLEGIIDGESFLDKVMYEYQKEIQGIDCSDLVDFSKEDVRAKFADYEIPDGFKFRASTSAGGMTLGKALSSFSQVEGDYNNNLSAAMGCVVDLSDQEERANKEEMKKVMAQGTVDEKFLLLVLQRNEAAMRIMKELMDLQQEFKKTEVERWNKEVNKDQEE